MLSIIRRTFILSKKKKKQQQNSVFAYVIAHCMIMQNESAVK